MVNEIKSDCSNDSLVEAETRTQADAARGLPAIGAQPSNTAPLNSIDNDSQILRVGVDSLYLSYSGSLFKHFDTRLIELKQLAQSSEIEEQAQAICNIQDSQFKVSPRGAARFPYILSDGMYNVRFSSKDSEKMPLAAVQLKSRGLTESGMGPAVDYLGTIIRDLGQVKETKVSRIDLCCDFTSNIPFGSSDDIAWTSRSNKRNCYTEGGKFTGYVFGQGSPMSARIYDKTRQIRKSKQFYLRDLWFIEGWDLKQTVWRLEFQIKRQVLVQLGIDSYHDISSRLDALWQYATHNWLRLVCPGIDKTKSRWPNHPFWDQIQNVDFGTDHTVPLSRQHFRREPLDKYFFVNGLAPITSYMAAKGIKTFEEAGPRLLKDAEKYHASRAVLSDEDIETYCQKRAAIKARDYSTRFPYTEVTNESDSSRDKAK